MSSNQDTSERQRLIDSDGDVQSSDYDVVGDDLNNKCESKVNNQSNEDENGQMDDTVSLEFPILEDPENIRVQPRTDMPNTTNDFGSLMNLIKGNLGMGILNMPVTFMNAGLWFGLGGVLFLGLCSTHCMHLLLKTSRYLSKVKDLRHMDYHDVAENSLKYGPTKFRKYSGAFRKLVIGIIVFTQMGFCCVYSLFFARMIKEVLDDNISMYHLGIKDKIPIQGFIGLSLLILIPFCCIKSLKTMSIFAAAANILTLWTLVVTFQYIVRNTLPSSEISFISDPTLWPSFFGSAMFAFESIGLILPIESKAKYPMNFSGIFGLLTLGMTVVIVLYCTVGFYGYLRFGSHACIVLSNLPNDQWLYLSARLSYAVAIFFSYNLQLYVAVQFILPSLKSALSNHPKCQKYCEYGLRLFLILVASAISAVVPCLEDLISLIGAIASTSLALIFPPIIFMCTFYFNLDFRKKPLGILKNSFIITLGVVGALLGTYVSFQNIYNKLKPGGKGCQESSDCYTHNN